MSPELVIRRAEADDVDEFDALVSSLGRVPLFRAIFGAFNYSNIVEFSHLSLLATCGSDKDSAVGFISMSDSLSLDTLSFESAVNELRRYIPLQMTNTVFINFWAVEEKSKHYKGDIGVEMVKKLFTICTDIDYIIWLCPISVKQTDYLQFLFEEIEIHEDEEIDERALGNNRILILRRESYLSRLSVREARVEDNDDLLPILLRSNPALIDGQEKFFLANLIQTRDESNRFYVGISENKLVGMLATSTDVNISLIKKFFDIDDFSDIILKREPKPKPPVRKIALVGNVHYLEESAIADLAAQLNCVLVDATLMLLQLDLKLRSQSEHDIDSAMLALRVLDSLIIEACDDFKSVNEGIPPAACIVTGFPRNEAEVGAILNLPSILDVVIEVSRTLSDSAQVGYHEPDMEEDATTLCHMDAADMLRMMYFSDEEIADSFRGHVQWIQLPDEGDILTLITEELTGVITRIETELRELLGDDNEEDKFHSNAFAVTLFCSEVGFETRAVDMLRVAFEDVASLDYCLCMVPNSSPVLPLVELMTPVKVRPGMSFEQSLYVMGKETFLASENVRVVRLTEELLPYFGKFLKPLGSAQDGAMAAARSSLHFNDFSLDENPLEVSYVMLFDKEVVGFVAISRRHVTDDDVTKMRASYRLDEIIDYEKYKSRSQAVISHWILSPIFFRWSRYILREVMRQSEKSLLYYQGIYGAAPAAEIVEELIPVAPRKMMQEPGRLRMKDRSRDLRKNDKGPLYLITRKKLSQRKATVNSRIVIAGGTSYAHAVLETFCFFPDVNFSNIYVVNDRLSTPFLLEEFGRTITGEGGQEDVLDMEFSGCLSVRDVSDPPHSNMYTLGLAFKSTLVRGHLTDIDRINKSIIVSDEVALEYDLLLIASPNQDTTVRTFPSTRGIHPATCTDRGIFGIGNPKADELALQWALSHVPTGADGVKVVGEVGQKMGCAVVIFGTGIDALAAVGGLIRGGVPASLIILVTPEIELKGLGHSSINEAVHLALQECGIEIHLGYTAIDVQFSTQNDLQAVRLENKLFDSKSFTVKSVEESDKLSTSTPLHALRPQFLTLECTTLLCCVRKSCEADIFTAINESGLVYDGGVVVDEKFRTIDPSIYAIGSYTRFSRVYKDAIPHSRFNSRELGSFAGRQMIETLLSPRPFEAQASLRPTATSRIRLPPPVPAANLPAFTLPRTACAMLPSGLILLHSSLPSWVDCHENRALVTGEPGSDKLCMLKLDYSDCAVEFVYIGTATIEEQNLDCIVGLHESYLGSALASFDSGRVLHWIDYFRQGWAEVLYHDRVWDLLSALRESVIGDRGISRIVEQVLDVAASTDDDQIVGVALKRIEGDRCCDVDLATKSIVEAKALEFLRKNKSTLPNLYIPTSPSTNKNEIMT